MTPRFLDLDFMSKLTERKIRKSVGVKTNKQLVKLAIEFDVDVGKKPETQLKRALQYFGGIENEQIEADYEAQVAAEKKLKADKSEAKKYKKVLVERIVNNEPEKMLSKIREVFKANKGKSIVCTFTRKGDLYQGENGNVSLNTSFDIPSSWTGFSSYWKKESTKFWIDSDEDVFYQDSVFKMAHDEAKDERSKDYGVLYMYFAQDPLPVDKLVQHFRDGITHCMLSPIRDWLEHKLDESKTKQTKSCYNTRLEKLCEFEKTYAGGVPEDALGEVCNGLQIDLTVDMPFSESTFIEVKSIKKALKHFNIRTHA
jgi:hypothetical protein